MQQLIKNIEALNKDLDTLHRYTGKLTPNAKKDAQKSKDSFDEKLRRLKELHQKESQLTSAESKELEKTKIYYKSVLARTTRQKAFKNLWNITEEFLKTESQFVNDCEKSAKSLLDIAKKYSQILLKNYTQAQLIKLTQCLTLFDQIQNCFDMDEKTLDVYNRSPLEIFPFFQKVFLESENFQQLLEHMCIITIYYNDITEFFDSLSQNRDVEENDKREISRLQVNALSKPMQRLPRYISLLKEIHKKLNDYNQHHIGLYDVHTANGNQIKPEEIIQAIENIINNLDEKINNTGEKQVLKYYQEKIYAYLNQSMLSRNIPILNLLAPSNLPKPYFSLSSLKLALQTESNSRSNFKNKPAHLLFVKHVITDIDTNDLSQQEKSFLSNLCKEAINNIIQKNKVAHCEKLFEIWRASPLAFVAFDLKQEMEKNSVLIMKSPDSTLVRSTISLAQSASQIMDEASCSHSPEPHELPTSGSLTQLVYSSYQYTTELLSWGFTPITSWLIHPPNEESVPKEIPEVYQNDHSDDDDDDDEKVEIPVVYQNDSDGDEEEKLVDVTDESKLIDDRNSTQKDNRKKGLRGSTIIFIITGIVALAAFAAIVALAATNIFAPLDFVTANFLWFAKHPIINALTQGTLALAMVAVPGLLCGLTKWLFNERKPNVQKSKKYKSNTTPPSPRTPSETPRKASVPFSFNLFDCLLNRKSKRTQDSTQKSGEKDQFRHNG